MHANKTSSLINNDDMQHGQEAKAVGSSTVAGAAVLREMELWTNWPGRCGTERILQNAKQLVGKKERRSRDTGVADLASVTQRRGGAFIREPEFTHSGQGRRRSRRPLKHRASQTRHWTNKLQQPVALVWPR